VLRGATISGADLYLAKFRSAELSGAAFVGANLTTVDFEGASLQAADMRGASLRYTNLRGANLKSAKLQGAQGFKTDFTEAVLDEANLGASKFELARFEAASLERTSLQCAFFFRGTDFTGATLVGPRLQGASLADVSLRGTLLVFPREWRLAQDDVDLNSSIVQEPDNEEVSRYELRMLREAIEPIPPEFRREATNQLKACDPKEPAAKNTRSLAVRWLLPVEDARLRDEFATLACRSDDRIVPILKALTRNVRIGRDRKQASQFVQLVQSRVQKGQCEAGKSINESIWPELQTIIASNR
jgi:hypothetical protein